MIEQAASYSLLPLLLMCLSVLPACGQEDAAQDAFDRYLAESGPEVSYWIKGGKVFDGQEQLSSGTDVLIRSDTIAYVGWVDSARIQPGRIINAHGQWVSPGFIDTHAHGDTRRTPEFGNFLSMGVTTICLGQDGSSPNVPDFSSWMAGVERTVPGVNVAMFIGHGTLRQQSGTGYAPKPEPEQMKRMEELLHDALRAGGFGMSTGLEYTPGIYAGEEELLRLARVVGEHGGMIMSHMRNEDNDAIEASLRELLRQGRYCNVQASHLKVVYGKGAQRAEEILAIMDSARAASAYRVTADLYPYTASYTGIGIVFPTWAKAPNDYATVVRTRRAELLAALREKVIARNGPEATLFGTVPYAGKTLAEVAREQGKPFEEVLLEIGPGGASGAYFVMDESLQARLLQDPHVMVCSDGSPTMHHPRGYGSFARIIEDFVRKEGLLTLPEALHKMTALPAHTLGLTDRGRLAPGAKADLLVFDPAEVEARADFSQPHRLARGFDWVLVNGKIAVEEGVLQPERHGTVLRSER